MKISDLIKKLKQIQDKEGDIHVTQYSNGCVVDSREAEVAYMKNLSKRESVQRYWQDWSSDCTPDNKGMKVVHIY